MARCDLCDAHCDANTLQELHHADRTAGVKDVCPSCYHWLDTLRRQLLDSVPGQIRAAIETRKGRPPRRLWFWPKRKAST